MTRIMGWAWVLLAWSPVLAADGGRERGEPRGYHEISRDLQEWLRRESRAATAQERAEAVEHLAALYGEIRSDARFADSPTLQGYRAKLWKRLTDIRRRLQREIAAAERRLPSRSSLEPESQVVSPGPAGAGALPSRMADLPWWR